MDRLIRILHVNAVKITELRQNLQHWITRARQGERIGVTVHGEIVAELGPALDRRSEAKRALSKLRRDIKAGKVDLGDVLHPIAAKWTGDGDHL